MWLKLKCNFFQAILAALETAGCRRFSPLFKKEILIASQSESFSVTLLLPILFIHALGIYGMSYLNFHNIFYLLLVHYLFVLVGASFAYHKYLSHKTFRFGSEAAKLFFLLIGALCLQGGPIFWASHHKFHHSFTDNFKDPHSRTKGFFWSHMGWLFYLNPNGFSNVTAYKNSKDLVRDKLVLWFEKNYIAINILFIAAVGILTALVGRPDLFFIIIPIRLMTVWHSVWLLNSYAHRVGEDHVSARKSLLISLLIPGEGDHSFHHKNQEKFRDPKSSDWLDRFSFSLFRFFVSIKLILPLEESKTTQIRL